MAANIGEGAQPRAQATANRLSRSAGDRAQLAATMRWLRELRPIQRAPLGTRRPGRTAS
jgi:hypothetical protein